MGEKTKALCVICNNEFVKREVRNVCCSTPCSVENRRRLTRKNNYSRYQTDKEYRKSMVDKNRLRLQTDPVYRENSIARYKEKYHNDPAFRQMELERHKNYYLKTKNKKIIKDSDVV